MPARRPRLIVMASAPRLGSVKTRLSKEIGGVQALRCARAMLRHTLERLSRDRRWDLALAITPDSASRAIRGTKAIPQGRGDLGRRMRRLLETGGRGPTILVGCDIPALTARRVAAAFMRLAGADAVFGPAEDGGYWLAGARGQARTRRMFEDVRWSSLYALADTIRNLPNVRIAIADSLSDLDDAEAYRRLRGIAERLILPPARSSRPRTACDAPRASA